MTTRQKALVFLLIATFGNIIITILYFAAFLLLTLYTLQGYWEQIGSRLLLLPLLLAIIASFFSYRGLIKWADRKWQIQEHLRCK